MITWMQRHKKWLIITIWISTIAFIGAGFVGWGSYDYGKSNNTVAIVGDKEIPLVDLQNEYSRLYSQYQQILGGQFNKELAKQFKLEDVAFKQIVEKYLLIQFASDLGLAVTQEDIVKELLKIKAFYKNGKFDKQTYLLVLKQNRQTAAKFEESLKKDILVAKLEKILKLNLTNGEIVNLKTILFSKDKVSVKVIDTKDINVIATQDKLKKYYNKHKESYKSAIGYKIAYSKIANIDGKTKKEMKKIALKEYLNLKKDKSNFISTVTLYNSNELFTQENFTKIIKSTKGSVLKPIYNGKFYIVTKLIKKIEPQVLSFDKVKNKVKNDFLLEEKQLLLVKKAQKIVKNFSGNSLGYISRDAKLLIDGLSASETTEVLGAIFQSMKKVSMVKLKGKIVIFKIEDSILADNITKLDTNIVKSIVQKIKTNEAMDQLIKQLQLKYEIKSFMGN